jgi:hypothetical protein
MQPIFTTNSEDAVELWLSRSVGLNEEVAKEYARSLKDAGCDTLDRISTSKIE